MRPHRAATATDRARETAPLLSAGLDAAWGHQILGTLLRHRRRLQRLDRQHPWLLDTAVVLLVACVSLPDLLSDGGNAPFGGTDSRSDMPTAVPYVLSVLQIVPLWWRRKAPAAVFFAIAVVTIVQNVLGMWLASGVGALIALCTLALRGSLRMLGWATAVAVTEVVVAVFVVVDGERRALGLFFLMGTVTAAVTVGLTLRIRRLYLAALKDRAKRLEVERSQRVRLTAAAERSRIAREMHDIVGHSLSVMVSVSDGAAVLAANRGEQSTEALRVLGDTGRQAMSELRRVLGVLNHDQEGTERNLSPQPGIADLDSLLTRVRTTGLTVTYRTSGVLDSLGDGVQLTVYRIVQEALTNTLKHAGASSIVEVTVTADAGKVRIRIADTGTPPGAPERTVPVASADNSGHGLVGIRQRAALYSGIITIGPRADRPGWIVDVELDTAGAPARRTSGEPTA